MQRAFLVLCLLLSQSAMASPPSFWERYASSRGEGLVALQEAQYLLRSRRFQEALLQAQLAQEKAPSAEADYVYAMSYFLSAASGDGGFGAMCLQVPAILLSLRERDPALADDPQVYLALGLCDAVNGDYAAARRENSRAAHHRRAGLDEVFIGFMNLGDVCMAEQDLFAAIEAYRAAWRRSNSGIDDVYLLFALAVAQWRSFQEDDAVNTLQQALALDPLLESLTNPNLIYIPEEERLYFLAVAVAGRGQQGLAQSYLGEYLSQAPEGPYRERAKESFYQIEKFVTLLSTTPTGSR